MGKTPEKCLGVVPLQIPIAAVGMMASGTAIGTTNYGFGIFVNEFTEEFGWSRAQINLALSLGMVTSSCVAPLVGQACDRVGSKIVITFSVCMFAAGFFLQSFVQSLALLYVSFCLVFLGFPGGSVVGIPRLVSQWFIETRGRAMGVVNAGNNLGGVIYVQLLTATVAGMGWRWSLRVVAIMCLVLALICLVVIRDPVSAPKEVDESEDAAEWSALTANSLVDDDGDLTKPTSLTLRQAACTVSYYLLQAVFICGWTTYSGVLTQLIPHLRAEGWSAQKAAIALSVVAILGIFSKLVFGRLTEALSARFSFVISLVMQIVALIFLIVGKGTDLAWVGIVLYGTGFGGVGALLPLTTAEIFGTQFFGAIQGTMTSATVISGFFAPALAGVVFDATGHYYNWFIACTAVFAVGIVLLLLMRPMVSRTAVDPIESEDEQI